MRVAKAYGTNTDTHTHTPNYTKQHKASATSHPQKKSTYVPAGSEEREGRGPCLARRVHANPQQRERDWLRRAEKRTGCERARTRKKESEREMRLFAATSPPERQNERGHAFKCERVMPTTRQECFQGAAAC